jgi:hypothetical protein
MVAWWIGRCRRALVIASQRGWNDSTRILVLANSMREVQQSPFFFVGASTYA